MSTPAVQPFVTATSGSAPAPGNVLASYESAGPEARSRILTELVGQVYEVAPLSTRRRLLETMLRPMGVLGLVTVPGGVFVKLRFGPGMGLHEAHLRLEDVGLVDTSDVSALVDRLQQVSSE